MGGAGEPASSPYSLSSSHVLEPILFRPGQTVQLCSFRPLSYQERGGEGRAGFQQHLATFL